ncbi:MAG TPA: tetratricopeptide repeat protein [Nitrospiria bacterium]|nr:tetratricopeptide repeat protein [Nitrospiria bacterium]
MRRSIGLLTGLAWTLASAMILLAGGCLPGYQQPDTSTLFPPSVPPPPSAEGGQGVETPRRVASLRLTEQGRGELERGDVRKAMERFEKAIGLDPRNPTAYYFFAEARTRQGDYRQSLVLLDRAEQLLAGQNDWLMKVYLLEGEDYEGMGNKPEAVKRYQKVLAINPENPEALQKIK